jgi:hypothetical protein
MATDNSGAQAAFTPLGSWTIKANSTPVNVSLSPSTASSVAARSQHFTATYSDADGATDLSLVRLLMNKDLSSANALYAVYNTSQNKLYLFNDAGTAAGGGFAPGSANTISNGQGSLNCAATSVSINGNNLVVNWNFTPAPGFTGANNAYLMATDQAGASATFAQKGTWTVSANSAPVNVSLSPATATGVPGQPQGLTATYSDANGAADISLVRVLVNASLTNANALYAVYNVAENKLYLFNDSGSALSGGFAPGSAQVISNSQGSLNCAATTVALSGNSLVVNWNFTPAQGFTGMKSAYLMATDQGGAVAAFVQKGTWTISANSAPADVSLSPAAANSTADSPQAFTAVYSDANGASDLSLVRVLVNGSLKGSDALYALYNVSQNKLYLFNDAGDAATGGFAPGSANVISNSQGSLNCAATTVTASGNNLAVNWNFTPSQAFIGVKNNYLMATDRSGATAAFAPLGTWTVKSSLNSTPVNVSVSPSSGTSNLGTPRTLSAVYSDADGAADIGEVFLMVNDSLTFTKSFDLRYNFAQNLLYVRNDANSAWKGGFAPGSNNTIDNGQGILNCAATTVTRSGNTVTVNWNVTPKTGFTGAKNIYLHATDQANASAVWKDLGDWTINPASGQKALPLAPSGHSY